MSHLNLHHGKGKSKQNYKLKQVIYFSKNDPFLEELYSISVVLCIFLKWVSYHGNHMLWYVVHF